MKLLEKPHPQHDSALADLQELEALKFMLDGTANYVRRKSQELGVSAVKDKLAALADEIDALNEDCSRACIAICKGMIGRE